MIFGKIKFFDNLCKYQFNQIFRTVIYEKNCNVSSVAHPKSVLGFCSQVGIK